MEGLTVLDTPIIERPDLLTQFSSSENEYTVIARDHSNLWSLTHFSRRPTPFIGLPSIERLGEHPIEDVHWFEFHRDLAVHLEVNGFWEGKTYVVPAWAIFPALEEISKLKKANSAMMQYSSVESLLVFSRDYYAMFGKEKSDFSNTARLTRWNELGGLTKPESLIHMNPDDSFEDARFERVRRFSYDKIRRVFILETRALVYVHRGFSGRTNIKEFEEFEGRRTPNFIPLSEYNGEVLLRLNQCILRRLDLFRSNPWSFEFAQSSILRDVHTGEIAYAKGVYKIVARKTYELTFSDITDHGLERMIRPDIRVQLMDGNRGSQKSYYAMVSQTQQFNVKHTAFEIDPIIVSTE